MKILMVCLGNICRSPLADGLLRKKIQELGLSHEVDSAGTAAYHLGKHPDLRTQANARKHGVDLSFLRARQFVAADFDRYDRIYAMDKSNLSNILALRPTKEQAAKVQLFLDLLPEEELNEVPDPYYGGDQGFEHVFQLADQATDRLIDEIKNL